MLARATGLEPAASCVTGQRCAEDSKWPKNRLSGDVISVDAGLQSLVRQGDSSSKWKVPHWKSVNPTAFYGY
jgi:hypothetical protein